MPPDPVTTAALINVGGNLLSNFLEGRADKKDLAAAKRQAAMDKLLGSLSSQPAQQSQRQQMQGRRTGVLETLATDPNLAMLLSKHLSSRPRPKPRNPFGIDPYK
jgi:hypothetical protein